MVGEVNTETIKRFRLAMAAIGIRAYLLSDQEVADWILRLVGPLAAPRDYHTLERLLQTVTTPEPHQRST